MACCVMCGLPLPDNQGSTTCSMCYGDVDHGRDGYYLDWLRDRAEGGDRDEPEPEPAGDAS